SQSHSLRCAALPPLFSPLKKTATTNAHNTQWSTSHKYTNCVSCILSFSLLLQSSFSPPTPSAPLPPASLGPLPSFLVFLIRRCLHFLPLLLPSLFAS